MKKKFPSSSQSWFLTRSRKKVPTGSFFEISFLYLVVILMKVLPTSDSKKQLDILHTAEMVHVRSQKLQVWNIVFITPFKCKAHKLNACPRDPRIRFLKLLDVLNNLQVLVCLYLALFGQKFVFQGAFQHYLIDTLYTSNFKTKGSGFDSCNLTERL